MKANEQLDAYVRELEEDLRRTKARGKQAIAALLTVPIPGGVGTVTVNGAGALVSVDLSPNAPWMVGASQLAAQIARAIHEAEQQATANRVNAVAGNGST